MTESAERIYALLVDANPIPDIDNLPPHLYVVDSRGDDMQTQTRQRTEPTPPKRRRNWVPALAGATAVVAAAIVVVFVAIGGEQGPVAGVPDIRSDLSNVGEVLTAAHNAEDPEVLLGLFAEDAELQFFGRAPITPADIRSGVMLTGPGSNYQYDRAWARTFNDRYEYSSCRVNGDRVVCDMTVTTDYLQPLPLRDDAGRPLDGFPHTVAAQFRDGEIVLFVLSVVADNSYDIIGEFQDWTQENYPEEAALMWVNDWEPVEVPTEESALLHLRLGQEYVQQQGS